MSTVVLVHGSWLGGWAWRQVVPTLLAAGHVVHTPTLTGLGDRAHLGGLTITPQLHVEDILAFMKCEDIDDAVLVGHSYSGVVITGVADAMPDRVRQLIYLDGVIPEDGKSIFDLVPDETVRAVRGRARANGDGTRIPPAPSAQFGVSDPLALAWVAAHSVGMPISTHELPVYLDGNYLNVRQCTYVYCSTPAVGGRGYESLIERLKDDPRWRLLELATGHQPMISAPRELAELILGCL